MFFFAQFVLCVFGVFLYVLACVFLFVAVSPPCLVVCYCLFACFVVCLALYFICIICLTFMLWDCFVLWVISFVFARVFVVFSPFLCFAILSLFVCVCVCVSVCVCVCVCVCLGIGVCV